MCASSILAGGTTILKIMHKKNIIPELLAPAGNFEKLEIALHYGADAVYLAGQDFSLRNLSDNFTIPELYRAVEFTHSRGAKAYIACNIYSRNKEQAGIQSFFNSIGSINPDAVIIADPGIVLTAKKTIPHIDIHLSTQANTTNYNTAQFWYEAGVKRVNLARELSLKEIHEISSRSAIETEAFVHGAMCISYSGRCLLSSFFTGRDSNRGMCTHPCRWKYSIVEEQRPGEFHPVMEDQRGTYIFSSKDLCMIRHIPELIKTGISSLKIEGRMKGIGYLASVVKTYREAIDAYISNPESFFVQPQWEEELDLMYHRDYCTGFYLGDHKQTIPDYKNKRIGMIHSFIGKVIECRPDNSIVVDIKNKISTGDTIEILRPHGASLKDVISEIFDKNANPVPHAQPNTHSILKIKIKCNPNDIIRKAY